MLALCSPATLLHASVRSLQGCIPTDQQLTVTQTRIDLFVGFIVE